MADVTNVFKATVKSVKSRLKTQGKDPKNEDISRILPTSKSRGQFETTAKEVVSTITRLKDFLLEHRKDYVNAGSHLTGEASKMTDTEREHIDTEAQNIIKKCQDSLNAVKKNAEAERVHPQVKEHREVVLTLITAYLKVVCKIYSEQRAVRVKRVVDKKRISRIEPERRFGRQTSHVSEIENQSTNAQTPSTSSTSLASTSTDNNSENSKRTVRRVPSQDSPSFNDSDDEISPEEVQMFEQENKAMFEEMNSLSEEISKIQGKVIEIASLQEIFQEKVLQQDEEIVKIADTAVFTTENIKGGNEEIREAMRKNAGFRVWILFFLLVLTFSLLFLDWYSG